MSVCLFKDIWKNQDAFIIGGGPSLMSVSCLSRLEGKNVIAVNDAYAFGEGIVSILFFGDVAWWRVRKEELIGWNGPIVTNSPHLREEGRGYIPLPRKTHGFHRDALGWNGNSGASAINLALITGARNIYLLGFDMKLGENDEPNWHDAYDGKELVRATEVHYSSYRDEIGKCVWEDKFPGQSIINLNPDSALDCFPKQDWQEVLEDD